MHKNNQLLKAEKKSHLTCVWYAQCGAFKTR